MVLIYLLVMVNHQKALQLVIVSVNVNKVNQR